MRDARVLLYGIGAQRAACPEKAPKPQLPPPQLPTIEESQRLEAMVTSFERLVAEHAQCCSALAALGEHSPGVSLLRARCVELEEQKRRLVPAVKAAARRLAEMAAAASLDEDGYSQHGV
jgi:hypothetical protein